MGATLWRHLQHGTVKKAPSNVLTPVCDSINRSRMEVGVPAAICRACKDTLLGGPLDIRP